MRLKLDENLPAAALTADVQLGHDVDSVNSENLTGATDDEVLAAATRNDRLPIALDRRFADVRAHPPAEHVGICVLRFDDQDAGTVTEACLLIRHGESVKVVQARLGHASASETLDTYSHLWPDSEDRTRQAVNAVIEAAPEDRRGAAATS